MISILRYPDNNFVYISHLSCYVIPSSHLPSFDGSDNNTHRVRTLKLLIIQHSPSFSNFLSLRSKYSPQHPDRLWGPPSLLSNGYGALSSGVKRQVREADHSTPSSAEVKKTWLYTSTTPYALMV
jgi:hypothetical protein